LILQIISFNKSWKNENLLRVCLNLEISMMIRIKLSSVVPLKRMVTSHRAGVRVITRKQLRCQSFKMMKKRIANERAKSGKVHLIGRMIWVRVARIIIIATTRRWSRTTMTMMKMMMKFSAIKSSIFQVGCRRHRMDCHLVAPLMTKKISYRKSHTAKYRILDSKSIKIITKVMMKMRKISKKQNKND